MKKENWNYLQILAYLEYSKESVDKLIGVGRFNTIIKGLVLLTKNQFLEKHSFPLCIYVEHLTICGGTSKIHGWLFLIDFSILFSYGFAYEVCFLNCMTMMNSS